jgi:hypothetical protein
MVPYTITAVSAATRFVNTTSFFHDENVEKTALCYGYEMPSKSVDSYDIVDPILRCHQNSIDRETNTRYVSLIKTTCLMPLLYATTVLLRMLLYVRGITEAGVTEMGT